MEGINIELLARARIIHDNGKQFISKDFKSLISLLELYETSARICHPQSNGKLERFHSTLKTEHVRKTPYFGYEDAKEKMAQWIDFYNNGRLHGALLYLTPEDYFEGRKESRLAERREKLHTAGKKGSKACRTKGKTSYCRYKQKSLLAATAALLNHLISFPKKVQVHFGQDNRKTTETALPVQKRHFEKP